MLANQPNSNNKAFISCAAGTDISQLTKALNRHGIDVLNFSDSPAMSSTIVERMAELIEQADLVIAVLGDGTNSNVMFELGFAASRNKKLVAIGNAIVPFHLSNVAHLKANLKDKKALEFQLDALLKNLDLIQPIFLHEDKKPFNRLRLSKKSNFANLNIERASEAEKQLYNSLNSSSEIEAVVAEPILLESENFRPDFAARFSKHTSNLAGSLVIELKSTTRSGTRRQWIDQVVSYTLRLESGVGLLVVDGPENYELKAVNISPLVFVVGLKELQDLLAEEKLAMVLSRERNRFAHSADKHD